jgi:hypothetical protein
VAVPGNHPFRSLTSVVIVPGSITADIDHDISLVIHRHSGLRCHKCRAALSLVRSDPFIQIASILTFETYIEFRTPLGSTPPAPYRASGIIRVHWVSHECVDRPR